MGFLDGTFGSELYSGAKRADPAGAATSASTTAPINIPTMWKRPPLLDIPESAGVKAGGEAHPGTPPPLSVPESRPSSIFSSPRTSSLYSAASLPVGFTAGSFLDILSPGRRKSEEVAHGFRSTSVRAAAPVSHDDAHHQEHQQHSSPRLLGRSKSGSSAHRKKAPVYDWYNPLD